MHQVSKDLSSNTVSNCQEGHCLHVAIQIPSLCVSLSVSISISLSLTSQYLLLSKLCSVRSLSGHCLFSSLVYVGCSCTHTLSPITADDSSFKKKVCSYPLSL